MSRCAVDVQFVDTTVRDGHQSLSAFSTRTSMMEAVAADVERAERTL